MHVARCVIISPFFLFSLSLTFFLAPFSHLTPPFPSNSVYCFRLCPHGGAPHHFILFYFIYILFYSPPHFVCLCPSATAPLCPLAFPSPAVACLPLSVMAYQEGFYSAADLYVSMPVSSTASLVTDHFFLLSLGFQV